MGCSGKSRHRIFSGSAKKMGQLKERRRERELVMLKADSIERRGQERSSVTRLGER